MAKPLIDPASSVVLQHAVRRWQAETENAGRLATRENGILGVIAMLLGLSLFRAPSPLELEPIWLNWTARILLSASVLQALAALGLVLWNRPHRARKTFTGPETLGLANALLIWPSASRRTAKIPASEREAHQVAIRLLDVAADEQYFRNAARKLLLDRSQRCLFGAATCAGLAMVCFLYLKSNGSGTSGL